MPRPEDQRAHKSGREKAQPAMAEQLAKQEPPVQKLFCNRCQNAAGEDGTRIKADAKPCQSRRPE